MLRITVGDTGPGIRAEDRARLFKPFSQLDESRQAPRSGTGLGLALTKQLVELMNGSVGVESEPGHGARFFVDLPIAPQEREPAASGGVEADGPLVLVVDDDPAARELIELALTTGGYRTLSVRSGEEALELARRRRPSIILLDVFLPGIDGWEVLRALKGDRETVDIPVMLVTISNDRRQAFTLGAVEHLVKPVERQALLDALARHSFTTKVNTRAVHVLVVDDDTRHLELVRAALEPNGFTVHTAATGRAGLDAARAGPADLMLLDLMLPDLSGVEVLAALRGDPITRKLPVLIVTGQSVSAEDRARLNVDAAAVLAKATLGAEQLARAIAQVLERA
jgi:CheY-like chemotaxis protein